MKIIKPSVEILDHFDGLEVLRKIEQCGRTCYKSVGDSPYEFVQKLIKNGHESVLEHFSFSVKFIVDRGISHQIVRHRIASYSQESTRYCNYSHERFGKEITVIEPCYLKPGTDGYLIWENACRYAEQCYFSLLEWGCSPEQARAVLPHSLKTELVMTANLREWRHFLRERTSPKAHSQMREVAKMLLKKLRELIPIVFDDIGVDDDEQRKIKC